MPSSMTRLFGNSDSVEDRILSPCWTDLTKKPDWNSINVVPVPLLAWGQMQNRLPLISTIHKYMSNDFRIDQSVPSQKFLRGRRGKPEKVWGTTISPKPARRVRYVGRSITYRQVHHTLAFQNWPDLAHRVVLCPEPAGEYCVPSYSDRVTVSGNFESSYFMPSFDCS